MSAENQPKSELRKRGLLRPLFLFGFVMTMVGATVLFYGFMLVLRQELNAADSVANSYTPAKTEDRYQQRLDSVRMAMIEANRQDIGAESARRLSTRNGPNEIKSTLSLSQIYYGAQIGDPNATNMAYLIIGLLITVLFGGITVALYLMTAEHEDAKPVNRQPYKSERVGWRVPRADRQDETGR